jgi:hypothetical protein
MEYKEIALIAAEWLEQMSSRDGSGHADLGRRIRAMVDLVDKERRRVAGGK